MLDASNPNLFLKSITPFSPSLQSHDCLRNGPPETGELMLVHNMEGQALNASYVKDHVHKYYQVRVALSPVHPLLSSSSTN